MRLISAPRSPEFRNRGYPGFWNRRQHRRIEMLLAVKHGGVLLVTIMDLMVSRMGHEQEEATAAPVAAPEMRTRLSLSSPIARRPCFGMLSFSPSRREDG